MTDQDRILLAEAMSHPAWAAYINPNDHPECIELPDPFTDANDCDDLIRFLNERGWLIFIEWLSDRRTVTIRNNEIVHTWAMRHADWKRGVCELALKVFRPTETENEISS